MKKFIDNLRASEIFNSKKDWMENLRNFAEERCLKNGFPTTKNEEWLYTKTFEIENSKFSFNYNNNEKEFNTIFINNSSITFSTFDKSIEVKKFSGLENDFEFLNYIIENESDDFIVNLAHTFLSEGLFINITNDLEEPLKIVYNLEENICSFPFLLINIEEGIKASILEYNFSSKNSFRNSLTKVIVNSKASLEYYKIQKNEGMIIDYNKILLEKSSNLKIFTISRGSKILRNNLNIILKEECGAEAYSLYLCKEKQHIDNFILIEHLEPNSKSTQAYKGVVEDKAKAAFTGKIFVSNLAPKTDASQLNKTLLMSNEAEMNIRPQLQIENDDVKCSHGATISKINSEQIFYLETRGIEKEEANRILSNSFLEDILQKINIHFYDKIKKIIF